MHRLYLRGYGSTSISTLISQKSEIFDSCALRSARSAALTAHRAVIHYRRLRFAYPGEAFAPCGRCRPIGATNFHTKLCDKLNFTFSGG